MTVAASRFATPKQVAFIGRLFAEGRRAESPDPTINVPEEVGMLTTNEASRFIDALLRSPRAIVPLADGNPAVEPGIYQTPDGSLFKVQKSKGSENLYAKKLTRIGGQRLTEPGEIVHWEFQYAPGAIRVLRAEQKLTLDEAKQFGIKYGVCCVCGAFLKDAKSVANGIGPVCAKRFAWKAA